MLTLSRDVAGARLDGRRAAAHRPEADAVAVTESRERCRRLEGRVVPELAVRTARRHRDEEKNERGGDEADRCCCRWRRPGGDEPAARGA